jgi:uncharacterized membrane protein
MGRTQPNVLDLMVALASGAAAGYALSRKEVAAALPGVAIAAALVPPLCVVGYGLGTSQLHIAGGSLLLFITNLIAIILAAALTFLALGFQPPRAERGELMRGLKVTVISLVGVTIILGIATISTVIQTNRQLRVQEVFQKEIIARAAELVTMDIIQDRDGFIITATVIDYQDSKISPQTVLQLQEDLSEAVRGPVKVNLTLLPATRGQLEGTEVIVFLRQTFEREIAARTAQVEDIEIRSEEGGFEIIATISSYDQDELSDAVLTEIQAELSEAVKAPVAIDAIIVQGRRAEFEAVTPNPEP